MSGLFMKNNPGDQVILLPMWAYKTLAKKGRIEDIANFSKMRQWFSQEQLVALDRFSQDGLNVLWFNGNIPPKNSRVGVSCYSHSLSYAWFFPEGNHVSENKDESDKYALDNLSRVADNEEYAMRLVKENILDYLTGTPSNKVDLQQLYSVYSASSAMIVLALDQGVTSPAILTRKEELRLMILRSIVQQLQVYYEWHVVSSTGWFEQYLKELDRLK